MRRRLIIPVLFIFIMPAVPAVPLAANEFLNKNMSVRDVEKLIPWLKRALKIMDTLSITEHYINKVKNLNQCSIIYVFGLKQTIDEANKVMGKIEIPKWFDYSYINTSLPYCVSYEPKSKHFKLKENKVSFMPQFCDAEIYLLLRKVLNSLKHTAVKVAKFFGIEEYKVILGKRNICPSKIILRLKSPPDGQGGFLIRAYNLKPSFVRKIHKSPSRIVVEKFPEIKIIKFDRLMSIIEYCPKLKY